MTDCDHDYELDSVEGARDGAARATRTAWLKCTQCGHVQARITQRSDEEIAAELAARKAQR